MKALSNAYHIFDLIAIKSLYQEYLKIHPDSGNLSDYSELKELSYKVCKVVDGLIVLMLSSITLYVMAHFFGWVFENQKVYDDISKAVKFTLEGIIVVLMFWGINLPKKESIFGVVREWILVWVYKGFKLDRVAVKSILDKDLI